MSNRPAIASVVSEMLCSGLHPGATSPSVMLTDAGWQELFALSLRQGITAIVWDGIRKLPEGQQPPRDRKIQWAVQAEQLEKRHRKQELTATQLAALLAQESIPMLVLKGIGLSHDYPQPAHRECGDIDIWLFGAFEQGNKLLLKAGAKLLDDVPKHTEMRWHGVMIENHRNFLNVSRSHDDRLIDDRLCDLLHREGSTETAEGYRIPSATFNAIYLLRHAALHFLKDGIVLRHVCDWACFRERHWSQVDQAAFDDALKQFRMERFAWLMTAAAVRCCGLREEMPRHDPKELERFIGEILSYEVYPANGGILSKIVEKCRLPYDNRWRFRLLGVSLAGYYRNALRAQWREKFTLLKP